MRERIRANPRSRTGRSAPGKLSKIYYNDPLRGLRRANTIDVKRGIAKTGARTVKGRAKRANFVVSGGSMRTLYGVLAVAAAIALFASQAPAQQLGSGNPSDAALLAQRVIERGTSGSGIFDIAVPPSGTVLSPVKRVPRDKFGVVGPLPLTLNDLDAMLFPGSSASEKKALLEGLTFFTKVHTPGEPPLTDEHGIGPMNNQPFCQGCHENTAEAIRSQRLLGPRCLGGSICASPVARAARSTPTNFEVTALDKKTGGGLPPDNLDAIFNTGKTAAFTTFGDFSTSLTDLPAPGFVGAIGFFDPLDGSNHNTTTGLFTSQPFGGQVQHVRPSVDACVPKPLPPVQFDKNLTGANPDNFRRSVGERAAPPYLGRGLMEAVPTADITSNTDPTAENGKSSLGDFAKDLGCSSDGCISGKTNTIPTTAKFVPGVGRFGLRANGVELLQFVVGGMQGELSLTNALNTSESNFPTLFPRRHDGDQGTGRMLERSFAFDLPGGVPLDRIQHTGLDAQHRPAGVRGRALGLAPVTRSRQAALRE